MSQSYDIFFAAQIVDGFDQALVRENLAKLFKANEETLDKLFSGKAQLIKRGVDKEAAIKYKSALQKAGAIALVRANPPLAEAAEAENPAAATAAAEQDPPSSKDIHSQEPAPSTPEAETGGTMADRIAALANAPTKTPTTPTTSDSLTLAPAGSEVLREDERMVFEELDIDTSFIHVDMDYNGEGNPDTEPPPPAPDTSHLSMGEVGEAIPHLESEVEPVDPDVSHLSMGEVGEEIPHIVIVVEPLDPDTSNINLAPAGSDVLEEQYRKREDATPPNTEHISLESAG